jgi:hypothetical protein
VLTSFLDGQRCSELRRPSASGLSFLSGFCAVWLLVKRVVCDIVSLEKAGFILGLDELQVFPTGSAS